MVNDGARTAAMSNAGSAILAARSSATAGASVPWHLRRMLDETAASIRRRSPPAMPPRVPLTTSSVDGTGSGEDDRHVNDGSDIGPTGSAAIARYLDGEGVPYELVEHEETTSAAAEARAARRPPDEVAKTVVLHDGSAYVIVAIPASERLDLHKLRDTLGASRRLRLASEDEIARWLPALDVGAIPPFGPLTPAAEVLDRALLEPARILCAAGDHRHSVLVDPRDVVRLTGAVVAEVCED
jgi:Ala-tRNA(Pro) deacylase